MKKREVSIALKTFRNAARTVPAYQKALKRFHINHTKIHSLNDFQNLPILDKRSYIYQNSLENLFPRGNIPPMAYASSGSSGTPTFWFRGDEQEKIGGEIHEKIFRDIFRIKRKDRVLVIICFAMGIWIAGNYTLSACRYISRKGYNITTITPGIEQEDIIEIVRNLTSSFQKIVLAGYPPFLMNVVSEVYRKRINLPKEVKILTAGDKFSENWRSDFLKLLDINDPYSSLVSIYGSADAGILGYETPLSIFLRRKISENRKLSKELFGNYVDLPGLVQYDPKSIFFEEVNGELVLTANTAAPLIRYNIHDLGHILSYSEVKSLLEQYELTKEARQYGLAKWRLPFLVLKGRTDVATTFYALNILPEHIRAGVENQKLTKFLSGTFFVYNKTINRSTKQELCIELELRPGIQPKKQIEDLAGKNILENLLKWNTEFRKLYTAMGDRVLPKVTLRPYDDPLLRKKIQKSGLLHIKGKKPKMSV